MAWCGSYHHHPDPDRMRQHVTPTQRAAAAAWRTCRVAARSGSRAARIGSNAIPLRLLGSAEAKPALPGLIPPQWYGDVAYWEARYARSIGINDWYFGYETLQLLLEDYLPKGARILHVKPSTALTLDCYPSLWPPVAQDRIAFPLGMLHPLPG